MTWEIGETGPIGGKSATPPITNTTVIVAGTPPAQQFLGALFALGLLMTPVACGLYNRSDTSERSSYAINKSNPLTVKDLSTIVEVSRNNESRFEQLYRGHYFVGTGTFHSAGTLLGVGIPTVTVEFGWFTPDVYCTNHSATKDEIGQWTTQTKLRLEGTIRETTSFGRLGLMSDCRVTEVR